MSQDLHPDSASGEVESTLLPLSPAPGTAYPEMPASSARQWVLAAFLLAGTLLSTSLAGLYYAGIDAPFLRMILLITSHPQVLVLGFPFSVTFVSILLAHELGHYIACRRYGMRCTPPYFLPLPVSIAGTLGAFIRIKSPFPSRRALFDVGVAGPLAGFSLVLPSLVMGIARSRLIEKGSLEGAVTFGEPLLFQWIGRLILGYEPGRHDMIADPMAMAAWFGLLATCLNLLPIWQLDGGHIAYALCGRKVQKLVSMAAVAALIAVSFAGWPIPSYLVFGLLLLLLGAKFRFYHPPTLSDWHGLDRGRVILAVAALLILVVSFTPVPITIP